MKWSLVLWLLLIATISPGFSQSHSLSAPEPVFTAVIVKDLDTSIRWYTTILGLDLDNKSEVPERGLGQANLSGENMKLELIALDAAVAPQELQKQGANPLLLHGYFKIGFHIPGFDEWMKFLREANVEFQGEVVNDPNSGKRMVIIRDPDGNRIQLFEK